MKKPTRPKLHKVGDIVNENGVEMQVMAADKSKKGYFVRYQMSAEPIAKRKGYITNHQIIGRRIEHNAPPFVPHGARRDPATMKESDWNFVELMKQPMAEKKVALFHELARESARVRLACARLEAGAAIESEWQNKKAAAYQKERQAREAAMAIKARLANAKSIKARAALKAKLKKANEVVRLAKCESSYIAVTSGNGQERVDFAEARRFLERLEKRFPYGVGEVMAWLVAKDVGWNELSAEERADVMKRQGECEARRVKHEGRLNRDVPCGGPGWPYDDPVQFAGRHWQDLKSEWPEYGYNDGKPGRMVLSPKGNGKDAPLVLSESLEICVCLNFSDEEILSSFRDWLQWRRKNLHDDLKEFRDGEGVGFRLDDRRIDKAFKAISALRLRAACASRKEAACVFRRIYEAKRSKSKDKAAPPMADVKKLADDAVALGAEFLPYCPLDSAPVIDPRKQPWDHLCSNCGKLQSRRTDNDKEPLHIQKQYQRWRCKNCDHRESSGWNGKEWILCED
jgi:hypothetical protein